MKYKCSDTLKSMAYWKRKKEQRESPQYSQSIIVQKGEKAFISGNSSLQKSYQVGSCVLE